jgi:hypothetical protein
VVLRWLQTEKRGGVKSGNMIRKVRISKMESDFLKFQYEFLKLKCGGVKVEYSKVEGSEVEGRGTLVLSHLLQIHDFNDSFLLENDM